MARGNSTPNNVVFISLKQKAGATEKDTPRFALATKGADGKWAESESYNYIEGMINKAYVEEKTIKEKKQKFFVLEMEDNGEVMKVAMAHGGLTYSIINSLASNINSLDKYKITVGKKQNEKYWNAQGFVNVNGQKDMQKWFVDPKTAPKSEPVLKGDGTQLEVNGDKIFDRSKMEAFWELFFNANIASKLTGGNSRPVQNSAPVNNSQQTSNANIESNADDEDFGDLPF